MCARARTLIGIYLLWAARGGSPRCDSGGSSWDLGWVVRWNLEPPSICHPGWSPPPHPSYYASGWTVLYLCIQIALKQKLMLKCFSWRLSVNRGLTNAILPLLSTLKILYTCIRMYSLSSVFLRAEISEASATFIMVRNLSDVEMKSEADESTWPELSPNLHPKIQNWEECFIVMLLGEGYAQKENYEVTVENEQENSVREPSPALEYSPQEWWRIKSTAFSKTQKASKEWFSHSKVIHSCRTQVF